MRTPFKFKFKRTIPTEPYRNVLERFKDSFEKSYCDNIQILNDNKLLVKNDILRWKPDLNWNIWYGIGNAEIKIIENIKDNAIDVEYEIDLTRGSTRAIIFIILIAIIIITNVSHISFHESFFFLSILIILFIIPHSILLLRHRAIFIRSINGSPSKKDNYDWTIILKSKSDHELKEISEGKTYLSKEVSALAKKELEKRVVNYKSNR